MIRKLEVLVLVGLGLGASAAMAQGPIPNVNDGNALLRECDSALRAADNEPSTNPDPVERGSDMGQCLGLVSGVWHTHMLMVDEFGSSEAFCPSETISAGQMARLVHAYLDEHPAELPAWDTILILRAFVETYPCP